MSEEIASADSLLKENAKLQAENARLSTELRRMREIVEQRDRALVAAHRKIEIALTDNIALLDAMNRLMSFVTTTRYVGDADREFINIALTDHHPGRALLAELDEARAVVRQARTGFGTEEDIRRAWAFDPTALRAAISAYDLAVKVSTE